MPLFIVGSLGCAVMVNGRVAAVLALLWVLLRRQYASHYRCQVGKKLSDMGLATYTVPAYFLCNTMCMATAVQALRVLLSPEQQQ